MSDAVLKGRSLTPAQGQALRQLARRAIGMSGADVERLVREARQTARRARRPVTFADLDNLLSSSRPVLPLEKKRRMAVHEAGHAIARIMLDAGTLTVVTIDGNGGNGFVETITPHDIVDTEARCNAFLQVILAGRAAEQLLYGSALSGSGGSPGSDLAKATEFAVAVETSLGFGKRHPLLYRDPDHWQASLRSDRQLADRVSQRLNRAERAARRLIGRHFEPLRMFTEALVAQGTLEGEALADLVASVSARGTKPQV